jgi:transglutaminase-like putative cysteine protease
MRWPGRSSTSRHRLLSTRFRYSDTDWTDLGALTALQYPDPHGRLLAWARGFVRGATTDTLALLKDLGARVADAILYQSRDEEGTQSPLATLDRGWGSCRDFAVLFAEAARCLGFGARIVSGYLHAAVPGVVGAQATHAWAEVFVPGAGWITFDPTNRSVGSANPIPLAVARDIRQVVPIGASDALLGMTVEVSVSEVVGESPYRLMTSS